MKCVCGFDSGFEWIKREMETDWGHDIFWICPKCGTMKMAIGETNKKLWNKLVKLNNAMADFEKERTT